LAVAAENWIESLRVPESIDEKIEESRGLVESSQFSCEKKTLCVL
jgi:hypothetical protein